MRILGISAFYHDSAAALLEDGRIVAAIQQERFSRIKQDRSFPLDAIRACLDLGNCTLDEIDLVSFYEKPGRKFDRLLKTYLSFAPHGFTSFNRAATAWLWGERNHQQLIERGLGRLAAKFDLGSRLVFAEHHQSHAASAFYPSPFEEAAILVMDGVGEWATTTVAKGEGSKLELTKEIQFPHSLGLLYAAFTFYTGFKINSGEYKMMGLAPHGRPVYADLIRDHLIDVKPDGSFRLNMDYFDYCVGTRMVNEKFCKLFGGAARKSESELTQRHMDLAASAQLVVEEVVLKIVRGLRSETASRNLCLAGGVALNCVANGKIIRAGQFDNVWIQPAAGDSGGALGAGLVAHHRFFDQPRAPDSRSDSMQGSYLGPSYSQEEIESRLTAAGARFEVAGFDQVVDLTVNALVQEKAVGWFQGRMEFGPRALGNRSILADPRSETMQTKLNLQVKNRESFRPFAPSVLEEDAGDWFDIDRESPYMLIVADVLETRRKPVPADMQGVHGLGTIKIPRSEVPAITHVDHSARLHTVSRKTNSRYWTLLRSFKERTGCPMLVNTSFNVRGEPIVCTPDDAFRCFMGTDIDCLVVGNCFLRKEDQDAVNLASFKDKFEKD